jgi:hypothetical protein
MHSLRSCEVEIVSLERRSQGEKKEKTHRLSQPYEIAVPPRNVNIWLTPSPRPDDELLVHLVPDLPLHDDVPYGHDVDRELLVLLLRHRCLTPLLPSAQSESARRVPLTCW